MRAKHRVKYKSFNKYSESELAKDSKLEAIYQAEKAKLQFAHVLADIREDLKLTQKQLAARVGVKQQVISRIESGSENLTLETLVKVLASLHVVLRIEAAKSRKKRDVVSFIKYKGT